MVVSSIILFLMIDSDMNEYLVPPDDVRALADRIVELLTDRRKAVRM